MNVNNACMYRRVLQKEGIFESDERVVGVPFEMHFKMMFSLMIWSLLLSSLSLTPRFAGVIK